MDIEKRRKQNMFSKVLHVKTNKEKMAAWNLNLGKILHVFNVSPTVSLRLLLTLHPQTELATSTHVIVSDTQAIVSKLDHTATRNHTMISEIHGRVVKGQDSQLVSDLCSINHRMAAHRRLDPSQVSDLGAPMYPLSHIRI